MFYINVRIEVGKSSKSKYGKSKSPVDSIPQEHSNRTEGIKLWNGSGELSHFMPLEQTSRLEDMIFARRDEESS